MAGGGALIACAPLIAQAQSPGKLFRVGILVNTTKEQALPYLRPFLDELRRMGYVEGKDIEFQFAGAEGRPERYAVAAAELVARKVDLIFSPGNQPAAAAAQLTSLIPIVVVGGDLVEIGLVKSLARPGGNVTGIDAAGADFAGKHVELLKRIIPTLSRVAALGWAGSPYLARNIAATRAAADKIGLAFEAFPIDQPSNLAETFSRMAQNGIQGLVVIAHSVFLPHLSHLAALALQHRIAVAHYYAAGAEAGALLAYESDLATLMRRSAVYVDKIRKGAVPGELPIEFATHFKLTINLKTAKALGIAVPPAVIALADRVIE